MVRDSQYPTTMVESVATTGELDMDLWDMGEMGERHAECLEREIRIRELETQQVLSRY